MSEQMSWLEQATTQFGEPHIALPEPVIRLGLNRRCWVWFVDGQNFNLAIDKKDDRFHVAANAPHRHIKFSTSAEPTDSEIRFALECAWPGYRMGPPRDLTKKELRRANREALIERIEILQARRAPSPVEVTHEVIMAFIQAPDEPDGDIGGPLRAAFRAAGLTVADGGDAR